LRARALSGAVLLMSVRVMAGAVAAAAAVTVMPAAAAVTTAVTVMPGHAGTGTTAVS
jgi:hypothetical protein